MLFQTLIALKKYSSNPMIYLIFIYIYTSTSDANDYYFPLEIAVNTTMMLNDKYTPKA